MQSSVSDMRSKGVKKREYHLNCCTHGNTTRSLSGQRELINPEISEYFAREYLKVFHYEVVGFKWMGRDKPYSLASDRRHQVQHGAGGDHLTLWDQVEKTWPAQL